MPPKSTVAHYDIVPHNGLLRRPRCVKSHPLWMVVLALVQGWICVSLNGGCWMAGEETEAH